MRDSRVAAKCPLCPHVVRPRKHRAEHLDSEDVNVSAVLRNAMRMHFYWVHPDLGVREATLLLDRLVGATATEQTLLDGEPVGPTALFTCPVDGCKKVLHTWLTEGRGKYLTPHGVARHALQQHLRNCHPGLSAREASLLLDEVELQLTMDEKKVGPDHPPQGPSAGGSFLPDPEAPPRPGEPAHAAGRVALPINVPPIKIIRRTSKRGKLVEVVVAGQHR